jgi:hypothetical protein
MTTDPYYRTDQQYQVKAKRYRTMYRASTGDFDIFDRHINAAKPTGDHSPAAEIYPPWPSG